MNSPFQYERFSILKELSKPYSLSGDEIDIIFSKRYLHRDTDTLVEKYFNFLLNIDVKMLIKRNSTIYNNKITNSIPQFSNLDIALNDLIDLVIVTGQDGIGFIEAGFNLLGIGKKNGAYCKYGENHLKILAQLGLIKKGKNKFYENCITINYKNLDINKKEKITSRLILTIPLISKLIYDAYDNDIYIADYLHSLSPSTQKRRISNINTLLKYVYNSNDISIDLMKRIKMWNEFERN